MAYMNQEKKAKIAAALKLVVPKSWKYSLSVHNHTTIIMTIKSAPVDLIAMCANKHASVTDHLTINDLYLERSYSGELLETFEKIVEALNIDNFDKSDIQTDYFYVGHYVDLNLGRWNKPFQVK